MVLKLDYVITNGYVDIDTISKRKEKGWNFIATLPAKFAHPHAVDTDKITIFAKYDSEEKETIKTAVEQ